MRLLLVFSLATFLLLSTGCGSNEEPSLPSRDELADFLEDNPDFADPVGTNQDPKKPLSLEN